MATTVIADPVPAGFAVAVPAQAVQYEVVYVVAATGTNAYPAAHAVHVGAPDAVGSVHVAH